MEIADLGKFLTIARFENLQKAANELDISPSALSKSLKRLETSLGLLLCNFSACLDFASGQGIVARKIGAYKPYVTV
ncbi:MAG: hypothetical protein ACI8WB_005488 [Phenylobacterium sp.]|jgi:hypothetical protein